MTDDEIRVATFDCYGTLIDWEGGAGAFLYELARRKGDERAGAGPGAARALGGRCSSSASQGPYRRYREMLADEPARLVRASAATAASAEDGEALARSMESWQPFPDTVPALRAASRPGLRLWIVSNTDRAIIEHTLRQLGGRVRRRHGRRGRARLQAGAAPFEAGAGARSASRRSEILHVAFGFKYDIATAAELGMRTAWVNGGRKTARPELPDPSGRTSGLWLT